MYMCIYKHIYRERERERGEGQQSICHQYNQYSYPNIWANIF